MAESKVNNRLFYTAFISIYKSFSCLWQKTNPDYYDRKKREAAYRTLLKKMHEIDNEAVMESVKIKIFNMRAQCRKEYLKILKAKEQGLYYTPTLWYYDLLSFIHNEESANNEHSEEEAITVDSEEYLLLEEDSIDQTIAVDFVDNHSSSDSNTGQSHNLRKTRQSTLKSNSRDACKKLSTDIVYRELQIWPREFFTEFIELFRKLPCLWDLESEDFNDRVLKDQAHASLLKKMREIDPDATLGNVKRRLTSMRGAVRAEFRKLRKARQNEEVYVPGLWYFDICSFVLTDAEQHYLQKKDSEEEKDDAFQLIPVSYGNRNPNKPLNEYERRKRDFIIEFIKIYQDQHCLWDSESPDYSNREKKEAAYENLLKKLQEVDADLTMENVKIKIKNLRSSFRAEYRRVSKAHQYNKKYSPTLWYFDEFSFVLSEEEKKIVQETKGNSECNSKENGSPNSAIHEIYLKEDPDCSQFGFSLSENEEHLNENDEKNVSNIPNVKHSYKTRYTQQELREFFAEFIKLYRDTPCLWKVNAKGYHNRYVKNRAYAVLLEKYREIEPDAEVKDVRKKIINLRTTFQRQHAKVKKFKKSGQQYKPPLWYYDLMLFVARNPYQGATAYSNPDEDSLVAEMNEDYLNSDQEEDENEEKRDEDPLTNFQIEANSVENCVDSPRNISITVSACSPQRDNNRYQDKCVQTRQLLPQTEDDSITFERIDTFELYGRTVADKLRAVNASQNEIAQDLINHILLEAEMNTLDRSVHVARWDSDDSNCVVEEETISQVPSLSPSPKKRKFSTFGEDL